MESLWIVFFVIAIVISLYFKARNKDNEPVYCAKCDQLLGKKIKDPTSCPHCGSNRIKDRQNKLLN
jgi:predicted Zn-ribbon and HTH transcriptional regulator